MLPNFNKLHIKTQKIFFNTVTGLIVAMHFFGFILMQWSVTQSFFEQLTPLNLLFCTFALLYFQPKWNQSFLIFIIIAFLTGYWIEVAGVATGLIFGKYQYGNTLGFKILEVPLLIGTNWVILTYITGAFCYHWKIPFWLKALTASAFMVLLDILIEPVAIAHDFWHWFGQPIPLQNYLAWFVIGFILQIIFVKLDFSKANPVAPYILGSQTFFFLAHHIYWFFS
jgi:putative membrane protein